MARDAADTRLIVRRRGTKYDIRDADQEVASEVATGGGASRWCSSASGRIGLILLIVVLAQLSPFFLTTRNIGNVMAATAAIAVLALGQLLVILTRGIDLSVARRWRSLRSLAPSSSTASLRPSVVVAAMLATGAAVGSSTASSTSRVAAAPVHHHARDAEHRPRARPLALRRQPDPGHAGGGQRARRRQHLRLVPVSAILVVAIALAFLLTTRIVWGRWIYAVGGNPEAARRTGIPVNGCSSPSTS